MNDDRDCTNCVHHVLNVEMSINFGREIRCCEKWECEFEEVPEEE